MKHLLLLLALLVAAYVAWQLVPKTMRQQALQLLSRHGTRLAGAALLLVALLVLAYFSNSTRLL